MILTVADVIISAKTAVEEENKLRRQKNKPEITHGGPQRIEIHGSKNLEHMLAAARRFVFRKGFPLDAHELRADPRAANPENSKPDYEDENLKVWKIPLVATGMESRSRSSSTGSQNPRKRKLNSSEEPEVMDTLVEGEDGEVVEDVPAGVEDDEKTHLLMQTVIKHMFDSDWKADTLVEQPLHKVKLPAKIFVRDDEGKITVYKGPLPGRDANVPDIRVLVREPWPGALVHRLPPTDPCFDSTCYIVKNHARRGKFQPANALKYGLPKWTFSKLAKGESVTAEDGTVVTPDMVLDPPIPGHGFALVDVRYEYLLDSLLKRPEWENKEIMEHIDAFYWILSPEVKDDSRLKDFMAKHSSFKHVVLGEGMNPNTISFGGASGKAIMMHRLDPDRFSIPNHNNQEEALPAGLASVAQLGKPGQRLLLSPSVEFQPQFANAIMDTIKPIKELTSTHAKAFNLALEAQTKVSDPTFAARVAESEQDIPNRDAEIVTLGTGSALPSKYRNVSATLIRVPGYGSYLFDCGENTLGQLRRVYGYAETDAILRDLRAIYISHLHADHHLGVPSVLARRAAANAALPADEAPKPLTIISTTKYIGFLHEYKDVEPLDWANIKFLTLIGTGRKPTDDPSGPPSADLGPGNNHFNMLPGTLCALQPASFRTAATLEAQTGLASIDACFVDHCLGATAAVFTWPSGLKISFSGDCRPSDCFAQIGKGSHLLIHECTFDDELIGEAKAKKHSTASEALDVGRKMGARRVLLTHFSQRYPKMQAPVLDELEGQEQSVGGEKQDRTVVLYAFDYMKIKLGEFKMAERFLPALRELYGELENEEEDGGQA